PPAPFLGREPSHVRQRVPRGQDLAPTAHHLPHPSECQPFRPLSSLRYPHHPQSYPQTRGGIPCSTSLGTTARIPSDRSSRVDQTFETPSCVTMYRIPASSAGTSSATAAVTRTCSARRATSTSAVRRLLSNSAKTSSSSNTGSPPLWALNNSYEANRNANANDHDSPWLAYPFAGASPSRSSNSSRCGPTRVTPRSRSASRDSANAARITSYRVSPSARSPTAW